MSVFGKAFDLFLIFLRLSFLNPGGLLFLFTLFLSLVVTSYGIGLSSSDIVNFVSIANAKGALRDVIIVLVPILSASIAGLLIHLIYIDVDFSNSITNISLVRIRAIKFVIVALWLCAIIMLVDIALFWGTTHSAVLTGSDYIEAARRFWIVIFMSAVLEIIISGRKEWVEMRNQGVV